MDFPWFPPGRLASCLPSFGETTGFGETTVGPGWAKGGSLWFVPGLAPARVSEQRGAWSRSEEAGGLGPRVATAPGRALHCSLWAMPGLLPTTSHPSSIPPPEIKFSPHSVSAASKSRQGGRPHTLPTQSPVGGGTSVTRSIRLRVQAPRRGQALTLALALGLGEGSGGGRAGPDTWDTDQSGGECQVTFQPWRCPPHSQDCCIDYQARPESALRGLHLSSILSWHAGWPSRNLWTSR